MFAAPVVLSYVFGKSPKTAPKELTLEGLTDEDTVAKQLMGHGIVPWEKAVDKAKLFAEAATVLTSNGTPANTKAKAFFVPGRVEVVGKHTDYAGGRSLLAAISKGFCIVTTDRDDDWCRFMSTSKQGEAVTVKMCKDAEVRAGHWSNYPVTALKRQSTNFAQGGLKGVDMSIACDLPGASGMSSSSAIICGVWVALNARNNFDQRQIFKDNIKNSEDLMEYLGCNENGQNFKGLIGDKGVGTFGGSEDHTAIMACTAGNLHMYSYCPTVNEGRFRVPDDKCFVIGVSGAIAEKTGDKMNDYNDAALLAKEAAAVYCKYLDVTITQPHLANVVKHANGDANSIRTAIKKYFSAGGTALFTQPQLLRRFDQFFAESEEIVQSVARAISEDKLDLLAQLVDKSQLLTDTHLQNQVPETVFLAKSARDLGAIAASAFGAGFGGSVWAYTTKENAPKFMAQWQKQYSQKFSTAANDAVFFIDVPGPGAFQLSQTPQLDLKK
eukprot:m.261840 g.261840  ORF g.261840 m.261840 type:complete len:497 (+) comp43324_c0_seq1:114-1604(+)